MDLTFISTITSLLEHPAAIEKEHGLNSPVMGLKKGLNLTLHLSGGKQQSGQQLRLDSADTSHHFQEMTNALQTATH